MTPDVPSMSPPHSVKFLNKFLLGFNRLGRILGSTGERAMLR